MPFVSKKQMKLCFLLQKKGINKGWNCDEWMEQTDYKQLPVRVRSKRRSRNRNRSRKSKK